MKISIIIPMFNSENYIDRCLNSIVNQSYKDLEIIVVNDGSTDNGPEICKSYEEKDHRVQVLHQKNSGQSQARNSGLEICTGEYVMFVDSDDELPGNAVENLLKPIRKRRWDVSAAMYEVVTGEGKKKVNLMFSDGVLSKEKKYRKRYDTIKTESVFGYVWGKLYRKEFIDEHHLRFDDIRTLLMEDALFNLKVWAYNPSYYISNRLVYTYYVTKGSSSNSVINNIEEKASRTITDYIQFLKKENNIENQLDVLIPLFARIFCWTMVHPLPEKNKKRKILMRRLTQFLNNKEIMEVLYRYKGYKEILRVPSYLQKVFYLFCIFCINKNWRKPLVTSFLILGPTMRVYAYNVCNK